MKKTVGFTAIAVASVLALAGCANDNGNSTNANNQVTSPETTADEQSRTVTLEDAYIREKAADSDMTAIFGTIVNDTDTDLNLIGFSVEGLDDSSSFELHEVVDGMMREIDGGYTIAADSEHALEPGADHLMIMNNNQDIEAGTDYSVTLIFADGTETTAIVPVRVQPSGEEDYADMSNHNGEDSHSM